MKHKLLISALVAASACFTGPASAQPAAPLPPIDDSTPIFGSQMMTPQERLEHRNLMRGARTLDERERIRAEHHDRMLQRARERGVTLPAEPPARGGPMGPGGMMMQTPRGTMTPGTMPGTTMPGTTTTPGGATTPGGTPMPGGAGAPGGTGSGGGDGGAGGAGGAGR